MPNLLNEWALFIASISCNLMISFTTTVRLLSEMASDDFFICHIQRSFLEPHFSWCFGIFNTVDHFLYHKTLPLTSITILCFEVCILTCFLFPILLYFLPSLEDISGDSFLHFLSSLIVFNNFFHSHLQPSLLRKHLPRRGKRGRVEGWGWERESFKTLMDFICWIFTWIFECI